MAQFENASRAAVVAPSQTVGFNECEALWVGGAGIVQVVFTDDSVVPFTCVAGSLLPVKAKRVNLTSTTATLIVALY